MKRYILATVLSLATTAACAGVAEQELESCSKANAASKYNEAIEYAAAAIKTSSDNRTAYLCQARAYVGLNDYAHALASLVPADQLAKTNLEHIVTLLLIGNSYKELKEFDKAIDQYKKGRELSQKERDAHFEMVSLNNIGMAQEGKSDYAAAVENYLLAQTLAANETERAESHAHLASAYSALNNYDKAIEHQIKAAFMGERGSDFDQYANSGLELGRVYLQAKQYANAEKTLNKLLENIILNKDLYWESKGNYYLSLVKREQGDIKIADKLLEKAKEEAKSIEANDLLKLFSVRGK